MSDLVIFAFGLGTGMALSTVWAGLAEAYQKKREAETLKRNATGAWVSSLKPKGQSAKAPPPA